MTTEKYSQYIATAIISVIALNPNSVVVRSLIAKTTDIVVAIAK